MTSFRLRQHHSIRCALESFEQRRQTHLTTMASVDANLTGYWSKSASGGFMRRDTSGYMLNGRSMQGIVGMFLMKGSLQELDPSTF